MRVLALWFPDWPIQAARLAGIAHSPMAIVGDHRIRVCDGRARRAGIKRGMRVRQARALCPELQISAGSPEREGRLFEPIAAGLDEVASSVEVLRPGLVLIDARAAGRYHGGEDRAAELLIDAATRRGVDALAGIADEIATAVLAARVGAVVSVGGSADWLAGQPLALLTAESSLDCEPGVVAALHQLGLRTLGEFAALPLSAVGTRFGRAGQHCHRIATGAPDRRLAPELPTVELSVSLTPAEPVERVDTATFLARTLAARLHQRLRAAGLVCLRLQVIAELADGRRLERIWRTREALSEQATADRVRWQLDGWLTAGGSGGIITLTLDPVEVAAPGNYAELWRSGSEREDAQRVVNRVQSTLGSDAVLKPRSAGGHGVAERINFIPYGEDVGEPEKGSWPGRIPGPLPARLPAGAGVSLVDRAGRPVIVTAEALLSGTPAVLDCGRGTFEIQGWAGPWPVDTHRRRCARLQVIGQAVGEGEPRAWLLIWERGWQVEAEY
ncbi:Y-family DNA polymerase [Corynebacterium sp. A21]|uniref:Y-family DNA polymerase n=1 Tax=Corynebacterium sp. A21 TaxID=3457318 RepID=UPI003FD6A9C8